MSLYRSSFMNQLAERAPRRCSCVVTSFWASSTMSRTLRVERLVGQKLADGALAALNLVENAVELLQE